MERNDGGPAFPVPTTRVSSGMSLLDYFAAKARVSDVYEDNDGLPSDVGVQLMGGTQPPSYGADPLGNARWWAEAVARWRYMMARAMLAEREKGGRNGD